jgi:hypothetical protein
MGFATPHILFFDGARRTVVTPTQIRLTIISPTHGIANTTEHGTLVLLTRQNLG